MQTIKDICDRNYSDNVSIINVDTLLYLLSSMDNVNLIKEDIGISFSNNIVLDSVYIATFKNQEEDFNLYIPKLYKKGNKLNLYLFFYFKPNAKYGLSGVLGENLKLKQAVVTEEFKNSYNIQNCIKKPYILFTYKSLKIINGICYIDEEKLLNREIKFENVVDFQERYPLYFMESVYYTKMANKDTSYLFSENLNNFRMLGAVLANSKQIADTKSILIKNEYTKLPSINITAKVRYNNDIYIRGYDYIISEKPL